MKKHIAKELKLASENLAKVFSDPSRPLFSGQTFTFKEFRPLSDHSAAVMFKQSGGKIALALALYKRDRDGIWRWNFNFLSDSHILGMGAFAKIKQEIELYNVRVSLKEQEPNSKPEESSEQKEDEWKDPFAKEEKKEDPF